MIQNLDGWHCKYKVTATDPEDRPARGRLDPVHQVPLFSEETRNTVRNCQDKAEYLSDPLPLEQMYDTMPASPNSKYGLPK